MLYFYKEKKSQAIGLLGLFFMSALRVEYVCGYNNCVSEKKENIGSQMGQVDMPILKTCKYVAIKSVEYIDSDVST